MQFNWWIFTLALNSWSFKHLPFFNRKKKKPILKNDHNLVTLYMR